MGHGSCCASKQLLGMVAVAVVLFGAQAALKPYFRDPRPDRTANRAPAPRRRDGVDARRKLCADYIVDPSTDVQQPTE